MILYISDTLKLLPYCYLFSRHLSFIVAYVNCVLKVNMQMRFLPDQDKMINTFLASIKNKIHRD